MKNARSNYKYCLNKIFAFKKIINKYSKFLLNSFINIILKLKNIKINQ